MGDKPVTNRVTLGQTRERAIELLSARYASDVIDIDEFERRVELAEHATSVVDINKLIEDLQPVAAPAPEPATSLAIRPTNEVVPVDSVPAKKTVVSVFGGATRKGHWTVPRKLEVWAVMGGADLDFRDARLAPGVNEVRVHAFMGGVDIIVPPGLPVEVDGTGIMGAFDASLHNADAGPDAPRLHITGVAIFGGVDIKERLAGESGWQARRRRKRHAKELRKAQQAQLQAKTNKRLGAKEE